MGVGAPPEASCLSASRNRCLRALCTACSGPLNRPLSLFQKTSLLISGRSKASAQPARCLLTSLRHVCACCFRGAPLTCLRSHPASAHCRASPRSMLHAGQGQCCLQRRQLPGGHRLLLSGGGARSKEPCALQQPLCCQGKCHMHAICHAQAVWAASTCVAPSIVQRMECSLLGFRRGPRLLRMT